MRPCTWQRSLAFPYSCLFATPGIPEAGRGLRARMLMLEMEIPRFLDALTSKQDTATEAARRLGFRTRLAASPRAALWSCAVLFFDTLRFLHSTTAVAASGRASEISWYLRECAASRAWRGGGTVPHHSLSERWNAVGDPRYLRHDADECDLSARASSISPVVALPVPPESVLPATDPLLPVPPCPAPDAMVPQLLTALCTCTSDGRRRSRPSSNKRPPETPSATRRGRWPLHEVIQIHMHTGLVSASKLSLHLSLVSDDLPRSCTPLSLSSLSLRGSRSAKARPSTHLISLFLPGSPTQPGIL